MPCAYQREALRGADPRQLTMQNFGSVMRSPEVCLVFLILHSMKMKMSEKSLLAQI